MRTPTGDFFPKNKYWLHVLLFVLTCFTTMLAGAELITGSSLLMEWSWSVFFKGAPYSASFLAFLTVHEFGHYFMARYHQVKTSLPYYIPIYMPISVFNIGSMGAIIRLRQMPRTTKEYFDIGIAGPLAGFVIALGLLIYGFSNLPELEYLHSIHPEYKTKFSGMPLDSQLMMPGMISMKLGSSILFEGLKYLFSDPQLLPPSLEIMHYPYIFVGYITLFFTALNLLPIGQLDGGHVVYGLFGPYAAGIISRITVVLLLIIGGVGLINFEQTEVWVTLAIYLLFLFYTSTKILKNQNAFKALGLSAGIVCIQQGLQFFSSASSPNLLWLFYAFIAVRVIKLDHPHALSEMKLNAGRKWLGWIALLIFVLCFTPNPIEIVIFGETP